MPKIDIAKVPTRTGSLYPSPHNAGFEGRATQRLGDAGGLTQFGANLVTLQPGARASLRHWHVHEDEFLIMTDGTLTLVDDTGRTEMGPGDCAAFPANDPNGHHMVNLSEAPGTFLVVGTRAAHEVAYYTDVDMMTTITAGADARTFAFTKQDGTPLEPEA